MLDERTLIRKSGGIETHLEFDGNTAHFVRKGDDLQPFLDDTARKRGAGRAYYAKDNELHKVASIPVTVQYEWLTKHGVDFWNDDHWPGIVRLLNSPDYRYLKTAEVII
jgi:hypothetical protein